MSLDDIPTITPEAKEIEEEVEHPPTVTGVETAVPASVPVASSPTVPETKIAATAANTSDALLDAILGNIKIIGEAKPPIKLMLYSLPGAGKTSLAGQIPNNLIIDTEHGRLTLDQNPDLVAENVKVFPFTSFDGIERTIKKFIEAPAALADIETITIDTLNNLHKRGLAAVTERAWAQNPVSNNKYVAETEHHTENNERVRQLVQDAVDTGRNIIIMAHSRTIEPKNQTARTFPDFSEKLANVIAGMVDVVGYMYMTEIDGENKRVIRFRPTESVTAKTRVKGLPDNMIDPTWDKILEVWNA